MSSLWRQPPLVLGISGDQTQHVLWRMQNGEFPSTTSTIFVVLIGTNNIGGGTLPNDTVRGVDAVGRYILQRQASSLSRTFLLLCELFPRHDVKRVKRLCPPRCNDKTGKPFESFVPAIDKVNQALPGVVQGWRRDYADHGARIAISSCGSSIFTRDAIQQIMPDDLHPNARGYELWARCLVKHISKLTTTQQEEESLPLVL